ncbi:MAG: hypothetical protein RIQ92_1198 [Actinomycetota bacterium]|jgi:hypothetical protein
MRVYLGTTADELQDFLRDGTLDIPEVYAPTPIYSATHPEMDEEEIEYSLSILAAEDALEFVDDQSGAAIVIALEVVEEQLGAFDEISAEVTSPLNWSTVEAVFLVGEDSEDLTWFAPQEAAVSISEWLQR